MISLSANISNPTERTYGDVVMYMKGIKPFTVRLARLEITIKPISLGIVYTSPK